MRIFGASDDLCEVDGDLSGEWDNCASGEPFYLEFGDGSLVRVQYDRRNDGTWQVERVRQGSGTFAMEYVADSGSEERGEGYTDYASLDGDLQWVRLREEAPDVP